MSGDRFLLDTNAVIALLQGGSALAETLVAAEWVGISIISWIEFRSYPGLGESDRRLFDDLCARLEVVELSLDQPDLLERIVGLRSVNRLKTPDAIIAATAAFRDAVLLTRDERLLGIEGVTGRSF